MCLAVCTLSSAHGQQASSLLLLLPISDHLHPIEDSVTIEPVCTKEKICKFRAGGAGGRGGRAQRPLLLLQSLLPNRAAVSSFLMQNNTIQK